MANFGPVTADIGSGVWGTPENFNGFRVLVSLLQRRCSTEANQTLHDVWPSPVLLHYVYVLGVSCPRNGILPGARFTLHPSLALSYIGSVTARHSMQQRASAKVCGVVQGMEFGTFAEGATYTVFQKRFHFLTVCEFVKF